MNYVKIDPFSIANGEGVRVALFVSGCQIRCHNCHNPEAWDFDAGRPWTESSLAWLMECLGKSYTEGLSVLGGEPLDSKNIDTVTEICEQAKRKFPDKTIWLYTGYDITSGGIGEWQHKLDRIKQYVDVIVDGPFVEALYNPELAFKGSENQRIWRKDPSGHWAVQHEH